MFLLENLQSCLSNKYIALRDSNKARLVEQEFSHVNHKFLVSIIYIYGFNHRFMAFGTKNIVVFFRFYTVTLVVVER